MNDSAAMQDHVLSDHDTSSPKFHDVYVWCTVDERDRMLRSFVFEAMIQLDIKDKLGAMHSYVEWIKTGKLPDTGPTLKAVK